MAGKSDSPSQTCAPGAEKAKTTCLGAALSQVVPDKTSLMSHPKPQTAQTLDPCPYKTDSSAFLGLFERSHKLILTLFHFIFSFYASLFVLSLELATVSVANKQNKTK